MSKIGKRDSFQKASDALFFTKHPKKEGHRMQTKLSTSLEFYTPEEPFSLVVLVRWKNYWDRLLFSAKPRVAVTFEITGAANSSHYF